LSVALAAGAAPLYAADGTWNGTAADGLWETPGNWDINTVAGNNSGSAATSTDTVTFASDPTVAPGPAPITVDLNRNVQNIVFPSTTLGFRIGPATANTGNTLYLSNGGTMSNTGGTGGINGDLTAPTQFASTYTFVNNNAVGGLRFLGTGTASPTGTTLTLTGSHGSSSSSQTEINGALVDNPGGAPFSVIKEGTGTWEMNTDASRPNTYSGDTTINGGILRASTATGFNGLGGFSPNSHYIINSGGTLRNSVIGSTVKKITINYGGSLTVSTAATTILNIKSESGAALNLNLVANAGSTAAIAYNAPLSLTGLTANHGGVTLLATSGAIGTGEVSLGSTAGPFNLGNVQRIFDIAEGADGNTYDLRTRGVVSGSGGITKNGPGQFRLDGTANLYTGATIVNQGIMDVGGVIQTAPITNPDFRSSSSLTVAGGARFVMRPRNPTTPSDSRVLQVGTLTLSPTATLDMTDNDLVVDSAAYTQIRAWVIQGLGAGTIGIDSSASTGDTRLALFDNAALPTPMASWGGGTISPTAIVGKYTFFGDVNIDGQVTGDDYTVVDSNLNTTPAVGLEWLRGDANTDGNVTGDDYTVIDANLGKGVGSPLTPSSLTVVPEPSAGAALAAGFATALLRRKRKVRG
jgi:autotransporter-associated beta strand protein